MFEHVGSSSLQQTFILCFHTFDLYRIQKEELKKFCFMPWSKLRVVLSVCHFTLKHWLCSSLWLKRSDFIRGDILHFYWTAQSCLSIFVMNVAQSFCSVHCDKNSLQWSLCSEYWGNESCSVLSQEVWWVLIWSHRHRVAVCQRTHWTLLHTSSAELSDFRPRLPLMDPTPRWRDT